MIPGVATDGFFLARVPAFVVFAETLSLLNSFLDIEIFVGPPGLNTGNDICHLHNVMRRRRIPT